uniref:Uncharacterized protein n=1 Tax=Vibrio sp. FF_307 TaxID=1652834 RepID=A0A0H4A451_9VIBR|nr:hypothetical protein [Vibrio sp. FF_307]
MFVLDFTEHFIEIVIFSIAINPTKSSQHFPKQPRELPQAITFNTNAF